MPSGKHSRRISPLLLLVSVAGACRGDAMFVLEGATMGTTYSVKYVPPEFSPPLVAEVATAIGRALSDFDMVFSTYRQDSEISEFNRYRSIEPFAVSDDLRDVVELALDVAARTGGAFDPTVKPLRDLYDSWGKGVAMDPAELARAHSRVGWQKLSVGLDGLQKAAPDLELDVDAIAKGAGVDRVGEVLRGLGIEAFFVEIGGEVLVRGSKPDGKQWVVGIVDPRSPVTRPALRSTLALAGGAMATSGSYFNSVEVGDERWHHIFDPRIGRNAENPVVSVSVRAPTCALADALATALMVLGPDAGAEVITGYEGVGALFLSGKGDGSLQEQGIRWSPQ